MDKPKNQDEPVEMMKRVFAVAEIIVQTDRYQEIRQKGPKSPAKTQKS